MKLILAVSAAALVSANINRANISQNEDNDLRQRAAYIRRAEGCFNAVCNRDAAEVGRCEAYCKSERGANDPKCAPGCGLDKLNEISEVFGCSGDFDCDNLENFIGSRWWYDFRKIEAFYASCPGDKTLPDQSKNLQGFDRRNISLEEDAELVKMWQAIEAYDENDITQQYPRNMAIGRFKMMERKFGQN